MIGPTDPKPPMFFFADDDDDDDAAPARPPTWPKPNRPIPMPSRSISDADFSRLCDAAPCAGLTGVGDTIAPAPDLALAVVLTADAAASSSPFGS